MFHTNRRRLIVLLAAPLLLAACAGGKWETDYGDVIDPKAARSWRVVDVDVRVPRSLTVSEANTYAPDADIVWRGDPPGDRYKQVDAILTEAIRRGSAGLRGKRPVRIVATVKQFHALTEKARYWWMHAQASRSPRSIPSRPISQPIRAIRRSRQSAGASRRRCASPITWPR